MLAGEGKAEEDEGNASSSATRLFGRIYVEGKKGTQCMWGERKGLNVGDVFNNILHEISVQYPV